MTDYTLKVYGTRGCRYVVISAETDADAVAELMRQGLTRDEMSCEFIRIAVVAPHTEDGK